MKQTLKERMENMLCRIVGRVEMLQKSINDYKAKFESANNDYVSLLDKTKSIQHIMENPDLIRVLS